MDKVEAYVVWEWDCPKCSHNNKLSATEYDGLIVQCTSCKIKFYAKSY